ncbi:MAG: tRNA1(Val) (adenine(37)-N6)-methyltransferase [Syntrophomonas sp.]|nr:tRNA1(Val) (adenine(37)-N6)-methyltransferase [Syntrophomonas sp.]
MADTQEIISVEETMDDLILGNMKIIQGAHGYRFSLDAVLLAHFPEITGVRRVFDLGTGSGVIPLLLAVRNPDLQISGVEIQPAMVDRARRSVSLNGLAHRIEIIQEDIKELKKSLPGGCAELVLSNPPFWRQGEGHISINSEEAIARHELNLNLEKLVQQGVYLLCQGGKLAIIQRAERLAEAMEIFRHHKLSIKRLRMVHSFVDRNAGLVLLEGQKNRPGSLTILPPLVIYEKPGEYSDEIKQIYREK